MNNLKEDRAMLIDLGADEKKTRDAISVIGQPLPPQENGTVVI